MNNVMLDLETLDTKPTAVILSIGAVFFDKSGLGKEFYRTITLDSCLAAGLTISGSTFEWWMGQKGEARKALFDNPSPLLDVLVYFGDWLHKNAESEDVKVWGNGADFDNAILQHAYNRVWPTSSTPWKFWNNRCYRTVCGLHGRGPRKQEGVHHNALDDAKSQAKHLIDVLVTRGLM
jgi:exodeoxyribonuclease VIII